jgi:glycosyltransferase involved in cell wall biosynthesis
MNSVYICGCVKNCDKYIDKVYGNILKISKCFNKFKIIIAYDESTDNSLEKLKQFENVTIIFNNNKSNVRTENISNARNSIINFIKSDSSEYYDYFIMMDFDDVCAGELDISVLSKYLNTNNWDSLSFNRKNYYDIWALSIDEYIYSCWGWHCSWEVVDHTRKYIIDKLSKIPANQLVECRSAFNGFAIYKTDMFLNCYYDWRIPKQYMTLEELLHQKSILWNCGTHSPLDEQTDEPDCEHRSCHMMAIAENGARIRISPERLF